MEITSTKTCKICHKEKELYWFHKNIRRPDGKSYMCRVCWSRYIRRWRTKKAKRL